MKKSRSRSQDQCRRGYQRKNRSRSCQERKDEHGEEGELKVKRQLVYVGKEVEVQWRGYRKREENEKEDGLSGSSFSSFYNLMYQESLSHSSIQNSFDLNLGKQYKIRPYLNNISAPLLIFNSNYQQQRNVESSPNNSSIHLSFESVLNKPYDYVGLFLCIQKAHQSVTASTAFLINPTTLLTCRHVFNDNQNRFATSSIIFIPGCINSLLPLRYQSQVEESDIRFSTQIYGFDDLEVGSDLAFIPLNRPIKIGVNSPKLKSIEHLPPQTPIKIIGYPLTNLKYNFLTTNIHPHRIQRQILTGTTLSILPKDCIIQHILPTNIGMSGAPIIASYQEKGRMRELLVGVHVRGGREGRSNLGLGFTENLLEEMDKWEKEESGKGRRRGKGSGKGMEWSQSQEGSFQLIDY